MPQKGYYNIHIILEEKQLDGSYKKGGNGNILVEVLKNKKKYHSNLDCLKTIYGIDISPENVIECRKRLIAICSKNNIIEKEAIDIVKENIICLNSLEANFEEIFQ